MTPSLECAHFLLWILAFLFRWLPGGGPFKALNIRTPTPAVEKLFIATFNATVDRYKVILANVDPGGPRAAEREFRLRSSNDRRQVQGSR